MKKSRLLSVLLTLVFLVSGISASSVFAAKDPGVKTTPKISEKQENKKIKQENASVEAASNLTCDELSALEESSTVTISQIDTGMVKIEISNDSPYMTVNYEDGTVEKSYSEIVVYAEPIYKETSAPISSTLSTSKMQVSNLSNNDSMKIQLLGTGSNEYTYASFNVSLYIKITFTDKSVNGYTVTRLDKVYGKLVSVGVIYFRNLRIVAQSFGAWADSATSSGVVPSTGANYSKTIASPSFDTLYSVTNSYSHFMMTGKKRGVVKGFVTVEYRHSSETGWSTDPGTTLQIGDLAG